ncbi:MAG: hypothetical protein D8M57_08325 [Candidatus Scalindua sp. AMX11]|nr:MAG: hypothetical protein DWQ00_05180 [Candidatus Scalindua sp.]TDE65349.1 MAG: hypothetical protein D8M57_08325 [Candidatus Scalindua sp. AMX11]
MIHPLYLLKLLILTQRHGDTKKSNIYNLGSFPLLNDKSSGQADLYYYLGCFLRPNGFIRAGKQPTPFDALKAVYLFVSSVFLSVLRVFV